MGIEKVNEIEYPPYPTKMGEGVPIQFSMLYSSSSTGGRGYTDDIEKVHIPPRLFWTGCSDMGYKNGFIFCTFLLMRTCFLLRTYLVGKSGLDNSIFAPIPGVKKSLSENGYDM